MADRPYARVVHQTPQRLRIKIPEKRYDESYFEQASRALSRKMPTAKVETNPATASILIRSEGAGALLCALGDAEDPFVINEWPDGATPQFEQIRNRLQGFNEWLRIRTGGRNDARLYIFTALVLGAMFQLARGEIMAPAATLLWYAGEALRVWTPDTNGETAATREARAH